MPSYPTSVWAPPTKVQGGTIQAADVNDAQDEIVAIEGGIRNGTGPLNSSNSTVASLHVTGQSTFAATVNINADLSATGQSSFATLSVGGGSTFANHLNLASTAALRHTSRNVVEVSTYSTPIFGSALQASTVASGGSLNIGNFSGVLVVTNDQSDAVGLFLVRGNGQVINEVADTASRFSTTAGTTNTTNVIFSGSTAVLLENRTGAARSYSWSVMGFGNI